MEYGGKGKELINNARELAKTLKNSTNNNGYVEKVDDGMRSLKTVTMDYMVDTPYIKSEGALLREGVKEVFFEAMEGASVMSTVQDVGTKGPAYVSPATAMIFEDGYSRLVQKQADGYGSSIIEDAGFKDAVSNVF